jgi:hypothetical protein
MWVTRRGDAARDQIFCRDYQRLTDAFEREHAPTQLDGDGRAGLQDRR